MGAVGPLAAGLGHDIGNLLMPLRAHLDSLEAGAEGECRDRDILAIRQCAVQLQRLAGALRLLGADPAKSGPGERVLIDDWWRECEPLVHLALGRGVRLGHRFASGLPAVRMGGDNLTQVIFLLVRHAGEAAGRRGQTVIVSAEPGDDPRAVRLSVGYDGPGGAEDATARGGDAAASVRAVVERLGGAVTVGTGPGGGSAVTLLLPIASEPAERVPRAAVVTLSDARTRGYVAGVLVGLGFTVCADGNSGDALLWITDRPPAGAADSFLSANTDRRVVVVGANELAGTDRMVPVAANFALIRQTLHAVASTINERVRADHAQPTGA